MAINGPVRSTAARRIGALVGAVLVVGMTITQGATVAGAAGDPTAPTLNAVNYSNYGATLSFAAPTTLVGTTLDYYNVDVSIDGGSTVYAVQSTSEFLDAYGNTGDPTASPWTDPNATSWCPVGTSCSWRIQAVFDGDATQSPWSPWVAMTPFGGAPP